MIYLARMQFAGYEITAVAGTEDAARAAVLENVARAIADPKSGAWNPAPDGTITGLWEYAGGNVTPMEPGVAQWL